MALILLGGTEHGIGAMEAVQDANCTKVVHKPVMQDKDMALIILQNLINGFAQKYI